MTDTPDDGYMTKDELLADLRIHGSTLWEWIKTGRFPSGRVLNPGAGREIVRWDKSEVRAWKDSRPRRLAQPITERAYDKVRGKKPMLRRPE